MAMVHPCARAVIGHPCNFYFSSGLQIISVFPCFVCRSLPFSSITWKKKPCKWNGWSIKLVFATSQTCNSPALTGLSFVCVLPFTMKSIPCFRLGPTENFTFLFGCILWCQGFDVLKREEIATDVLLHQLWQLQTARFVSQTSSGYMAVIQLKYFLLRWMDLPWFLFVRRELSIFPLLLTGFPADLRQWRWLWRFSLQGTTGNISHWMHW